MKRSEIKRTEFKRRKVSTRYLRPGEDRPEGTPRRYTSSSQGYVVLRWRVGADQYVETRERNEDGSPTRTIPFRKKFIDHAEVKRLYVDEHKATPEIAKLTGFTAGAIWRSLERSGVALGRTSTDYAKQFDLDEFLRRYDALEGYVGIATDMRISPARAKQVLIDSGRDVRPKGFPTGRSGKRGPRGTDVTYQTEFNRMVPLVRQRSGGRCETSFDGGCTGAGEHVHHRQMRSQGGKNIIENLLDSCAHCHRRIHGNPKVSYMRGLLVRQSGDPSLVPVLA